jgi:hypothetical protein
LMAVADGRVDEFDSVRTHVCKPLIKSPSVTYHEVFHVLRTPLENENGGISLHPGPSGPRIFKGGHEGSGYFYYSLRALRGFRGPIDFFY